MREQIGEISSGSEDEELSGSRTLSSLRVASRRGRTDPLPLPAPGTEPGLVPPDPEALTPWDFRVLAFLGVCAIPCWLVVREMVVVCFHVCDGTPPLAWLCSCPETGAWRSEVDCTPTLVPTSEFRDPPSPGRPALEQDSQYSQWGLPLLLIPFVT